MQIDYSRDSLLTDFGKATLFDRYLLPTEKSPQDAFARAAKAYATDDAHAQRIYDYASKLWFMFSTPILSNGGTGKGLPISCYLNYVPDSLFGIMAHYTENGWLAAKGGGIGGCWSDLRSDGTATSTGSRSTGSIPFLRVVDAEMGAFSQGSTRRGSYAAYMDIDHPEIEEFIKMRKLDGGDMRRKCPDLHHGVNIPDWFMTCVERGLAYDLKDPHTKKTTKTLDARTVWMDLLEIRHEKGEPYLHFIDRSNEALPYPQKVAGLRIRQSNLCSEITLPTNEERTAVCCLSSVNLETYEEWKDDPLFIADLIEFLDNVITYFCENAPAGFEKAVYSAMRERSLGLGAMGWHSYLQRKRIPFESPIAVGFNLQIFSGLFVKARAHSRYLGTVRGEAPDNNGMGLSPIRNMNLLAIAPNATSSIICGTTSPSVEPYCANAFTQKTSSGSFLVKNRILEEVLIEYGQNTDEVWSSIVTHEGSVQHLDFLSVEDKKVFKTALEIDQRWIVKHAADRQKYICQSQSINLFLSSTVDRKVLHDIHYLAYKSGLKTLYYLRSEAARQAEVVSEKVERKTREDADECWSCQG